MEVILLERVKKLGEFGDLVTVKDGFGRNFLLPMKKAIRATEQNKSFFAEKRAQIEQENQHKKSDAEKLREKISGITVSLIRQASEDGRLFGSVTARDIAAEIKNQGFEVDKASITLNTAIKMLGDYEVDIQLHPEVNITTTVTVVRPEIKMAG